MIASFASRDTKALHEENKASRQFAQFARQAKKKLMMLDAAVKLGDLRNPPGNRLEALSGTRQGQFSVRIKDQWRLCFRWHEGEARDVEIVDYH